MASTTLYDKTGAAVGSVELDDELFAAPVSVALLHQVEGLGFVVDDRVPALKARLDELPARVGLGPPGLLQGEDARDGRFVHDALCQVVRHGGQLLRRVWRRVEFADWGSIHLICGGDYRARL